jgi:cysteine desulfurase
MTAGRTYLDWNATAPLRPRAREAMFAALDAFGNPSSPHADGRRARAVIENAREQIAASFKARAADVYFTSGATEAANWVLAPNRKAPFAALLLGATEHACVLQGHRFPPDRVEQVPVNADGLIDLAHLESRLSQLTALHGSGSVMVAIQAANNETGVIQPAARIAEIAHAGGAVFVCDAVQAAGRIACDGATLGADVLFLSAHKLGGPKGAGAVVFARDDLHPDPLLRGGGQERRQRSGTENVAAIAGFSAAIDHAVRETDTFASRAHALQQRLERGLRAIRPDTIIFGEHAPRLTNTTCFAAAGIPAETGLIALDLAGIAVSSGSACSSGKIARSHVLNAMGTSPAFLHAAIRVSTGWSTGEADIDTFLGAWERINHRQAGRKVA